MGQILKVKIEGSMPYRSRLQFLDLIFWRTIQYGASRENDLLARNVLPAEAGGIFSSVFDVAERSLERARVPAEATIDREWLYFDENVRRQISRSKGFEDRFIFYPTVVRFHHERRLVDELLDQEGLTLPAASLALAAAGYEPFDILSLQTENPLKIDITLRGTLAVLCVVLAIGCIGSIMPARYQMGEDCSNIADAYKDELIKSHLNKERIFALHEAFQGCYSSPLFSANPIQITLGEDGK